MPKEGHSKAHGGLLCPRSGGRRVQRSLRLSLVPTLLQKKGTVKLAPASRAHAVAKEGYSEACACLSCPRSGGRRVQRSLRLSLVPAQWRKKGTVKLAPASRAHAVAKEGYSEACACLSCPRSGGRRVQRSLCLSLVPAPRQNKRTLEASSRKGLLPWA